MTWVVLELTPRAEQEDPDAVAASIAKTLKVQSQDIYIPTSVTQVGADRVVQPLYDGYAFARLLKAPGDYFRLENTKYVQAVLLKTGAGSKQQRISTISDTEVLRMRDQVRQFADQGIGVGDTVRILSGPYRNILAEVVVEIPETDTVQVFVKLRSKQSLLNLPRSFLIVEKRAPYSRLGSRIRELAIWAEKIGPVLTLTDNSSDLVRMYKDLESTHEYTSKADALSHIVGFEEYVTPQVRRIQSKLKAVRNHNNIDNKIATLSSYIEFSETVVNPIEQRIIGSMLEVAWLDELTRRVSHFWLETEALRQSIVALEKDENSVVNNIIVDGHNLAFRCMFAMESQKLKDRSGRPTGAILGFIRSLGALKKRFPEATLYVAWDGSSQRRRQKFADYKGTRPKGNTLGDSFALIKDVLTSLGVYQIWNPVEEADDVIATIVRGPLEDQRNLIFTTDRDLLQCVNDRTKLLYPSVGSRNEVMFDVAAVQENFGVPPDKLVQLRSLCGDDSDNIPGVPRVPKKILKQLVQTYGSVAGIFQAGLAELSKGQYDRLRAAEPQVRINADLMMLVDVDFTTVIPDVDPDEFVKKLRALDIDPTPHLATFFGRTVDEQ